MMHAIVERFAQLVATTPDPVIASSRVGARTPATAGDLPAIVVSLTIVDQRTSGLGRVMRPGETVTRHSAIVRAQVDSGVFSSERRTLQLVPLPMRKNPASTHREFGADDIEIANLTDAAHPVAYRYATSPAGASEFSVDFVRARIAFGEAQTANDTLEVVHWTVTQRDDIEGAACRGVIHADVWGVSPDDVAATASKLQDRLSWQRALVRERGFSMLLPASMTAAAPLTHTPAVGSPFACWRLPLTFRFSFEFERPAQDSSAGPITRIDVDVTGAVRDTLVIPRPTS